MMLRIAQISDTHLGYSRYARLCTEIGCILRLLAREMHGMKN